MPRQTRLPPPGYVARRLGQSALVLWAAFTLAFAILYILPSDPVSIMLNQAEQSLADAAQVAALRAEYNLDQPLVVQYGIALWRALHLDLGRSIQTGQPVAALLAQAIPATATLAAAALALALVGGIGLALAGSLAQAGWLRAALLAAPALGVSLPTFWIGLLLLQALSFHFFLFPAMGNEGWQSLVLPALTLAVPTSAAIAQVLGRSLAAAWGQPFAEAIRAKGVSRPRLLLTHVLPNAAVPLLTMAGIITGNLLAGSVVTETVFSREGVGRLAQGAVAVKDIPVVQGVVLLAAASFVLVNLLVDLLYPLLDPRILQQRQAG
ncbi:ABC transporter permease [Roseomonas sp. 18066]|uniref:ABC transporter permease n=1 Tax=Roseomonas sp. 18066 TaxID=2681412 RepID=UPI00135A4E0A|nr:ABC transporter permease [Roseomonas sp. 18066]